MNTTYQLKSAQEINSDFIESIKSLYKTKPITITIEETESDDSELTDVQKAILDERLLEDESTYLTGDEALVYLKNRYGI